GPVEDTVADVDPETREDLRVNHFGEDDRLLRALLQCGPQRLEEVVVELLGGDNPGLDPILVLVAVLVELLDDVVEQGLPPLLDRSEERRVGKEGRFRSLQYLEK